MTGLRLLDSLMCCRSLDDRHGLIPRLCFKADPVVDSAGGGGGGTAPDATPPVAPDAPPSDDDISTDASDIDEAKLKRLIEDRNRKNRLLLEQKKEAEEMRAKLAELEAAEEERKKAEMSEIERAKAEAAEALAKLEEAQAETSRLNRETAALSAGVDPMLIGPVGLDMLAKKIDVSDAKVLSEYFAALKAERPKWFMDSPPAPPAAGGPQGNPVDPETAKLAARMDELLKIPRIARTDEQKAELSTLLIRQKRIEEGKKGV